MKERWPVSLKVFRDALITALAEHGIRAWPFGAEAGELRVAPFQRVRDAFYSTYPAEGEDEARRAETKRKAFNRAVQGATTRDLIGSVELTNVDHLWLKQDAD